MERKYIFHYTAKGFLFFVIGLLCLFITCIFLVFNFPDYKFVNYGIFALLAFFVAFLSFKVDKMALIKKNNSH